MLTRRQATYVQDCRSVRCTPNFDIQHEVSVKSKHLLLISDNKGSVRDSFIFRVRVNTDIYLCLRKRVLGTLHDVNCLYSLTRVMLKLWRRARGHFVTLIKIGVHLITCNPGHPRSKPLPPYLLYTIFDGKGNLFMQGRSRDRYASTGR